MRFSAIALLSAASTLALNAQTARIMTQNMDEGTNESYVLAFASSKPKLGVDLTLAEVVASGVVQRADALAASIAAEKPDIVGLQEVGLWRFGLTPSTADFVLYDQLNLILAALRARGVPYRAVAVNNLTDLALPATVGAVRLTDRDAMIVRSDSAVQVHNPQSHFGAAFPFGTVNIVAGWISADVQVGAKDFLFVSTHLMSPIPGVPQATDIQIAQSQELLAALKGSTVPQVISGDLNSDANGGNGPDATGSVALIKGDGYTDDWALVNPGNSGELGPSFFRTRRLPSFSRHQSPSSGSTCSFLKGLRW